MSSAPAPSLSLEEALYTQGFGTRALCTGLVQRGLVAWVPGQEGAHFALADELSCKLGDVSEWPVVERAYVMLHKPAGYECSAKPSQWPSVYSLLPAPLRNRPVKGGQNGVQAVGRLDQDTTGLLLLSDDGAFLHRLTSPKHHVPKVYQVTCKHAVTSAMVRSLIDGVTLRDEPLKGRLGRATEVAALACEQTGEHTLALTLGEGKYHQVKRMVAAVGNRCEALHRSHIGELALPHNLPPGGWRWLSADDLALLH